MDAMTTNNDIRVLDEACLLDIQEQRIAEALATIESQNLYGEWASFDDYCRERWGIAARRGIGPVTEAGGVYFISPRSQPVVKIGVARHFESRFRVLQTAMPERIRVLGVIPGGGFDLEAEIHDRFARDRISGEWFRRTSDLGLFIAEHAVPAELSGDWYARTLVAIRDSILREFPPSEVRWQFETCANDLIRLVRQLEH